jgi:hypothetical protein
MNITQFIGIQPNALSNEECDELVSWGEAMMGNGLGFSRNDRFKEDIGFSVSDLKVSDQVVQRLSGVLNVSIEDYLTSFRGTTHLKLDYTDWRFQKTQMSEGYHEWHCEAGGAPFTRRMLAWTIYLNTVEQGGETEFLYQSLRVAPVKGTMVVFPCQFTHVHRGNPPLSGDKYIITGWVEAR